jgi:hypothetical protein
MSKYDTYDPQPRDFWRSTDPYTVANLIPFVRGKTYAEPCYGAGDLEDRLMDVATCNWRSDLDPQVKSAVQRNALTIKKEDLYDCTLIITNPPYAWGMLQPLLDYLPTLKPTWFLLPADFMHNKRSGPYIKNCSRIVSVGRLYFHKKGEDEVSIKHAKQTTNYAWYLFNKGVSEYGTKFYGQKG